MKYFVNLLVLLFFVTSCYKKEHNLQKNTLQPISTVLIDTLTQNELSMRAILVDEITIWFGANNGSFGSINLEDGKKTNGVIMKDSLLPEFRSIAQNKEYVFLLSVGSPGLLYRISKKERTIQLIYENKNPAIFYDAMRFDDDFAIAFSDPIMAAFPLLISQDGGNSWEEKANLDLKITSEGEASFAASNSTLVVKKNHIWIASGGKATNVYYSNNLGKNWKKYATPIISGKTLTGIFSMDFYNETIGFVVGGDYENPNFNSKNKAKTTDGGKTWQLVADKEAFGYASCVKFFPNRNGQAIITVGASGIWLSNDFGSSWKQVSQDPDLYSIQFVNDRTAIAAGKGKIIRLQFS